MSDIFEEVKRHVGIRSYIEADCHVSAKRVGDGSYRINPCPFCGANDAFTINDKGGFFRCFSCQAKGDVIEYEQQRYELENALDTARRVAEKMGLVINAEKGTRNAEGKREVVPPPPEPDPVPDEEAGWTAEIDEARACKVRAMAADFYHNQLMEDPEALAYQIERRGHSLEILKACKVGYAKGGGLIKDMKTGGVEVSELVAVGLVRKRGAGYGEYIAAGFTVYPHYTGDRVLFFTIKDPKKEREYQIKKRHAGKGWLCWGQDALESDKPLVIVEGENDRLSVMDKGGYPLVMATIASFNEPAILRALKGRVAGRVVYLAFDADKPKGDKQEPAGARYTRIYAGAVIAGGGEARQIVLELGPNGEKCDIDDVLRRAEDPKKTLVELMKGARAIRKVDPKCIDGGGKEKESRVRVPPPSPELYEFDSFQVLGELQDDSILFWSKVNERLYRVNLNEFKLEKLVQIGGKNVSFRVARSGNAAGEGQILFQDLRKRLIVEASQTQLWDPDFLGQGIHAVGNVMLVVVGGDAWVWDGKQMKPWIEPVLERQVIERKKGYEWVNFGDVEKRLKGMDRKAAYKVVETLADWVFQWRFRGPLDGWIVVGWMLAQYIQSLWVWRPHLWLAGPAASGKTSLRDLVGSIGGQLTLECEGQTLTEPGLRQAIGTDGCLVLIDEMEKSTQREAIIKYIRSAGKGGWTRKGASDQKGVKAKIKHMVFLSSIERGLHRAADISRYLRVETAKGEGIVLKMPDSRQADELRAQIVAYGLWAGFKALTMIRDMDRLPGHDPRFIESLSVPFSMVAVGMEDSVGVLQTMIREYLEYWTSDDSDQDMSDEEQILKDILLAHVKVPVNEPGELRSDGSYGLGRVIYPARTLGQLLEDEDLPEEHRRIMEAHGVKLQNEGIFLQPEKVAQELLRGSNWEGYTIRELLKRIPGVLYGRAQKSVKLAGTVARGILLPWDVLPRLPDDKGKRAVSAKELAMKAELDTSVTPPD